jgi:uncharacterized repeat protein (TIGR03803 family)
MPSNGFLSGLRYATRLCLALVTAICFLLPATQLTQAQAYSVLHSFTGPTRDGGQPGFIMLDANGTLYGTACAGGTSYGGIAFSLSPTGKENILYNFLGGYGSCPNSLVPWMGEFYGASASGGAYRAGAIFKLDRNGKEVVLYSFHGSRDASAPVLSVTDGNGTFYGTDYFDGAYGYGMVFKVDTAGKETTLYSFGTGADGSRPTVALVRDEAGNLYGTTSSGGDLNCGFSYGCGTVFKLDTTGKLTTLHRFKGGSDGISPSSGLIREPSGKLYGVTSNGGNSNCSDGCGTVFVLDASGKESVLYSFSGPPDGSSPGGNLVRDEAGNLYGVTGYGGDATCGPPIGCGTVFKLDTASKETVLHRFNYSPDGAYPLWLVRDGAGDLYGTAAWGGKVLCMPLYGPRGCGTVFKLTP